MENLGSADVVNGVNGAMLSQGPQLEEKDRKLSKDVEIGGKIYKVSLFSQENMDQGTLEAWEKAAHTLANVAKDLGLGQEAGLLKISVTSEVVIAHFDKREIKDLRYDLIKESMADEKVKQLLITLTKVANTFNHTITIVTDQNVASSAAMTELKAQAPTA